MSGGGGSYDSPKPSGSTPCEELVFTAILQSPDPVVVKRLRPGDELSVELAGDAGPVHARHPKYGIAGSIVTKIAQLLRCLSSGFEFVCEVKDNSNFGLKVEVRPKC